MLASYVEFTNEKGYHHGPHWRFGFTSLGEPVIEFSCLRGKLQHMYFRQVDRISFVSTSHPECSMTLARSTFSWTAPALRALRASVQNEERGVEEEEDIFVEWVFLRE